MDLSLSAADVTALEQRTEGWSADLLIRFPAFTGGDYPNRKENYET
jgi:hypothetical protein